MYHRPVCVKCNVEMKPEKNGIGLLDMANFGPYQLWDADLYKCSICGCEIITGFGSKAIAQHSDEGFDRALLFYNDNGCVKSWHTAKAKEQSE